MTKYCLICKKLFIVLSHNQKSCSKKCSIKLDIKRRNNATKKMYAVRGNWYKEILIKYLGSKCLWCNDNKNLHIHHQIPLNRGGRDEIANLELVCRNCHINLHNQINKIWPLKKINSKIR